MSDFDRPRERDMRKLLTLAAMLVLTAVVMVAAPSAGAYGNTAVYQITFSLNCTSVTPGACDQFGGPGGVWGWIELDAGGSGDGLPPFVAGTGLDIPSDPGHYSMHPFPGLAAKISVVKIPNR